MTPGMPADVQGVLLHFDVEFTHPVPGIGQPMQFGFVAQPAIFFPQGHIGVSEETIEFEQTWPVSQNARVTSWVTENQQALLRSCRSALRAGVTHQCSRDELVRWLRDLKRKHGDRILPCGWTLGSDMAYLLWALGEDCHLVHYDALDVSSLAFAVFGRELDDDELRAAFGREKPADAHTALADARHQALLMGDLLARVSRAGR